MRAHTLIKQIVAAGVRAVSPCVLCGYEMSEYNVCDDCADACEMQSNELRITHVRHLWAGYLYQFPLHSLLHKYKYHKQQQLATALCHLLLRSGIADTINESISHAGRRRKITAIVPVPLHPTKLRERGFNQSLPLAHALGRCTGLPVFTHCIERVRMTSPQAQCASSKERLANVAGAFSAASACPERVLLVDDVVTTGATVSEIARTMKRHGTKQVVVVALCISEYAANKAKVNLLGQ